MPLQPGLLVAFLLAVQPRNGATDHSAGESRAIFERAIEHGNMLVAEAALRALGNPPAVQALGSRHHAHAFSTLRAMAERSDWVAAASRVADGCLPRALPWSPGQDTG